RRPLGVALVDVVLGFNAGTGVEVLGEVQLGTTAQVGEGGAVTATGTVLADALVGEASGDVRTQGVTRGVEVVQGIQGSVGALDVAAIFGTSVVYFVVTQTQFDVIGQEVTDRTTEQVAIVCEVA